MTLYYSPGACSLSPHIVAQELGLKIKTEKVDLKTHTLVSDGSDYYKISPKGAVPALKLDNGELLTEGAVIVQYLCDQVPNNKMLPKWGELGRYRVMEWLNYIASEIHKGYSPLFSIGRMGLTESTVKEYTEAAKKSLVAKYKPIEAVLGKSTFLTGDQFSPADAYLFTVTTWARSMHVDLTGYPKLMGFMERVHARPAVQAATDAEKGK